MLKNKKTLICISIVIALLIVIFLIFRNNMAKKLKTGNNSTSQEISDYVLNISSYETTIEVNVKSNKNENKYIIKQIYKGPEDNMQEVLEPSNISRSKNYKK